MKGKTTSTRSHLTYKRSISLEENAGSSTSKRQKVNINDDNDTIIRRRYWV